MKTMEEKIASLNKTTEDFRIPSGYDLNTTDAQAFITMSFDDPLGALYKIYKLGFIKGQRQAAKEHKKRA